MKDKSKEGNLKSNLSWILFESCVLKRCKFKGKKKIEFKGKSVDGEQLTMQNPE